MATKKTLKQTSTAKSPKKRPTVKEKPIAKKQPARKAISTKKTSKKTSPLLVAGVLAIVIFGAMAVVLSLSSSSSSGPVMQLETARNSIKVGDHFRVGVYSDSQDVNVNAVQASVTYPADHVEFADVVDNDASSYPIRANQSVESGKIEITKGVIGGVTNKALVSEIEFVAKQPGSVTIAYDKQGTVLLKSDGSSNILKDNSFKQITIEVSDAN